MQGLCHYRTSEDYRLGWLWWLHKSMWDFCFFQRTLSNELLKWNAERQEGCFAPFLMTHNGARWLKVRDRNGEHVTCYKRIQKKKDRDLNTFSVIHLLTSWLNWQIPDNTRKRTFWWDTLKVCSLSLHIDLCWPGPVIDTRIPEIKLA